MLKLDQNSKKTRMNTLNKFMILRMPAGIVHIIRMLRISLNNNHNNECLKFAKRMKVPL